MVAESITAGPARATFHLAEISEIMTAYNFTGSVQFVEIRMLAGGQGEVAGTKLAVFGQDGGFFTIALTVPSDVNSGSDRRWLMARPGLEALTGLQPDFEFTQVLPIENGMVCWGQPGAAEDDPDAYVDCVSYGTFYRGPPNTHTAAPSPIPPYGFSLQRVGDTNDSSADFVCGDPANPENNDSESVDMVATGICPGATSTTTTTLGSEAACGDGNTDGSVTATDALLALSTAVQTASCPLCLCDVDLSSGVTATDALRMLNAAVGVPLTLECPPC
jgi:hypothetical protein